jgi:formamidopyrimidine-DNA glycosylase
VPELPDLAVYLDCLGRRVLGHPLERIRIANPFVLRTVDPPLCEAEGALVTALRRVGKRVALALEGDLFLVIHLMVAGRFRWRDRGAKPPGRIGLAAFDFPTGTLLLTEAGSTRRASLHLLRGEAALRSQDPGGIEVLESSLEQFRDALLEQNHTLKRALTDPRLLSGIGNAYSDEILHAARLSPLRLTGTLSDAEVDRLHRAAQATLGEWIERLRRDVGDGFPEKVTAFRDGMAVHGRYGKPCPACGAPVQRIVYADNETNYCARCQTGGRRLADRALSRLLGADWPRTVDD